MPLFAKIGGWFTAGVSFMSAKIASDTVFKVVAFGVGSFFISQFTIFFIWVLSQISNLYQNLNSFFALDFTTDNEMLLNVLGGINCIGIFSGLNSGIDLIMTALVFRVLLFLGKYFIAIALFLYKVFTDVMNTRAT